MSDTEIQIEEVIQRLFSLRDELSSQLASSNEAAAPVDLEQPFGRLSRMDAIQQQQMVRTARMGLQRRLEQVKLAIARAQRGEYGFCVSCDEDIESKRLNARPEAPLCMPCQSELEARRRR